MLSSRSLLVVYFSNMYMSIPVSNLPLPCISPFLAFYGYIISYGKMNESKVCSLSNYQKFIHSCSHHPGEIHTHTHTHTHTHSEI